MNLLKMWLFVKFFFRENWRWNIMGGHMC
jgi:hypothetical protein